MTLTSFSNPHLDGAGTSMESDSRSASTSSTDFHSLGLPLSENSEIFLQNGETLMNLRDGGNANDTPKAYVIGSNNVTIGTEFKLKIQGDTQFSITNVYEGGRVEHQRSIEDAQQKDASPIAVATPIATKVPIARHHFKTLLLVITSITMLCVIILVTLSFKEDNKDKEMIATTTEVYSTTRANPLIHYTFNRMSWGAREPSKPLLPLDNSVSLLIIKHTETETCLDVTSCFTAMQNLQNSDVGEHGLRDIRYNFVVGGDGNIYEGRGWKWQNEQMNNSVDIAFMGNFSRDVPSDRMVGAGPWLVVRGIMGGYVNWAYVQVVGHNQTEYTDSPGANLYREVIKWTYYSNEIIFPR